MTDFGSKFDTAADFIFTVAVVVKICTAVYFPAWLMIWIVIIALIKIRCHIAGYLKYHELKTVHSVLNKVCGGVIFILPLLIGGNYAWQAKTVVIEYYLAWEPPFSFLRATTFLFI